MAFRSRFFIGRDSGSDTSDTSDAESSGSSGSDSEPMVPVKQTSSGLAQLADSSSEDEGDRRVFYKGEDKLKIGFKGLLDAVRDATSAAVEDGNWATVAESWKKLQKDLKKYDQFKDQYWILVGEMWETCNTSRSSQLKDKKFNRLAQEMKRLYDHNKEAIEAASKSGSSEFAKAADIMSQLRAPARKDRDKAKIGAPGKAKPAGRAAFLKGAQSDSSDSESEDEAPRFKKPVRTGRSRFLKDDVSSGSEDGDIESGTESGAEGEHDGFTRVTKRKEKEIQRIKLKEAPAAAAPAPAPVKKADPTKLTAGAINTRLDEIELLRGKKSTTIEQIEKELAFLELGAKANKFYLQRLRLLHLSVSIQFDSQTSFLASISLSTWRKAHSYLSEIVSLMEEVKTADPSLKVLKELMAYDVLEISKASDDEKEKEAEKGKGKKKDEEKEKEKETKKDKKQAEVITGQMAVIIERLDDELTKGLQETEPRTVEYIERLCDEGKLLELAGRIQTIYEAQALLSQAARIAHRRVERLYYRHASEYGATDVIDRQAQLHKLAVLVYQHCDERRKTRTMLCHVYHHALHSRYHAARDMLLMSHLQDNIAHTDLQTQILFNRVLIQLGFAAFSNGMFLEAHQCMADICQSGRQRELLAQGIGMTRFGDSPEQEKAEKRRQVPAHMHIPADKIELVHLTSAVLLEVPSIAQHGDSRKHVVSKSLRKHLDYMARQVLCGPPENTRDVAMVAARALLKGNWRAAEEHLLSQDGWKHVMESGKVKQLVSTHVRLVALRIFFFTHSSSYVSISLDNLCRMFDMKEKAVRKVVSQMIYTGLLRAAWSGAMLVIEAAEPSKLQTLALHYADKATVLAELNGRNSESAGEGHGHNHNHNHRGKRRSVWVK